jgi:lipopolysaccharide/colanic/teichoic acid biosynthesis glycosyltransferase
MTLGRAYCRGPVKRVSDVAISAAALIVLAPVFLVLSVAAFLASGRPVLFTQERVGMDGHPFRLVKFRTMHSAAGAGLPLTGKGDPRVTRLGRFLRATKLDELPQLWNVLRGEMSLVGPRPEVPRYVARYTADQRRVLEVRPGLTDPASVLFRDEEALIGSVPEGRRETFYLETVLPKKLRMNLEYIDRACVTYDLALVLRTIRIVLWPEPS